MKLSRKVLSVKELSEYLGCSIWSVYRLVHDRGLPYFRVGTRGGGDMRFNIEEIDVWRFQNVHKEDPKKPRI